jgi:anaerobic selenocysteine-containing dehydrogenase
MGETRHTVYRSCTLCEATCGLALEVEGDRIVSVRGDDDDVFSGGYVCPKGVAIAGVHHDPDRLRTPMRRAADGGFEPIGWGPALDLVAERLSALRVQHGRDAIAVYMGNPIIHNHGALLLRAGFLRALGTRNSFSAGSQDTSPRFATSYHLYGSSLIVPIPDLDRTHYFLCIGANPWVSNGSFMTAPDVRRRLRGIRERGGRIVVVDPRRTETAREADEWIPIRPGSDAAFLLAMVQTLVADGRIDEAGLASIADGWPRVRDRLAAFAPGRVATYTGIPAATIERLARELADAPSGLAYTRVGVCNNRFGTLASWASDVLNLAAGRLGEVGGAMFPTPAVDVAGLAPYLGDGHGRWRSRVRGLPETLGDLPAAALAEEIETPGAGQVRALVVFAGNPVLSVPNGRRLAHAFGQLDFMVAIDLYVNETTRHADVILPPAWTLAEDHFEVFMPNFAVRNVARWCPPVVGRAAGERADWEILLEIAERLGGGATGIPLVDRGIRLARRFGLRWTPTAMAALLVRIGPHGDRFLPWSKGLNLARLAAAPHGVDLGPLEPGIARRVLHRDRRVRLAPAAILSALGDLERAAGAETDRELLLVGRRELRSNNSWMHNVPAMAAGRERCVLFVHPADAERARVRDGEMATLVSRVHRGPVRVQLSDDMAPGVVSLPHGWGHADSAPWQRIAGARPGVSANDWTDDGDVEAVVGQSILNGVPVRLEPAVAQDAERFEEDGRRTPLIPRHGTAATGRESPSGPPPPAR